MAYPHDLKCPTNINRPRYVGIDDRTGFKLYLDDMEFQHDWRGNALQNLRILTGKRYLDEPQEQLRAIIIGPDSVPPTHPRPPSYESQAAGTSGPVGTDAVRLPFGDEPS